MTGSAQLLPRFVGVLVAAASGCARPDVTPHFQELAAHDERWLSQAPPDPAQKILSGLDGAESLQQWLPGTDVLYVVRVERGNETRIHYVRIQLKSDVLKGIEKVRLNPAPGPAGKEKVLDIFDPGQDSYELAVVGWSMESSPENEADATTDADGESKPEGPKLHSEAVLGWMALYDEAGDLVSARYTLLPEAYLRKGFLSLCDTVAGLNLEGDRPAEMTSGQAAVGEESNFALRCMGKIIAESQVSRPIVRGIVPGFDLLLMKLFKPRFTHTLRGAAPAVGGEGLPAVEKYGPACRLELDINVNDQPTIRCFVTVALPRSPIDACGGVLAMQCAHLDDPSRRVSVHLLAARRPPAPASPSAIAARRFHDNENREE